MAIVGFNFTSIKAEKKGPLVGKVDIKNAVAVTGIEASNISLGSSDQKVAKFTFDFNVSYGTSGSIKLSGEVLFLGETKKIEDFVKSWDKDKSVPKDVAPAILNTVLSKSNIQAINLSELVSLPSPVPLPKVRVEEPTKKEKV